LSARVRWVVSDSNRCDYGKELAEADLTRTGLSVEKVQQLLRTEDLPDRERSALQLARELTLDAAAITDEEIAQLIRDYDPATVVALVLTIAHQNFQDRLALALGLTSEPGGPPPAQEIELKADAPLTVLERPDGEGDSGDEVPVTGVDWGQRTAEELRAALELQKRRTPRIPIPSREKANRPSSQEPRPIDRNLWGAVTMGYQPALSASWSAATEAFRTEAALDEVLAESIFWVVTRTNDCFY